MAKTGNSEPSTPQQAKINIDILHTAKPVCITLRNQLPPTAKKNRKEFISLGRLSHLKPLLTDTRLEVCTKVVSPGTISSSAEEENETIVLWSCINEEALHPSWDHLDKYVRIFCAEDEDQYDEGEGHDQQDFHSMYLNSFARVVACQYFLNENDESNLDIKGITTNHEYLHKQIVNDESGVLAEIPLHPSNLRRLPAASSDFRKLSALPPNALIVEYSDGSVRVTPDFYSLLLKNGVITEETMSANDKAHAQADLIEQRKREQRFNDDVFDTLGDSPSPSLHKVNGTKSRSVFEEDAFQLLGLKSFSSLETKSEIQLRRKSAHSKNEMMIFPRQCRESSRISESSFTDKASSGARRTSDKFIQGSILSEEIVRQRILLKQEEDAYSREIEHLQKSKSSFNDMLCKLEEIEKEIESIHLNTLEAEQNLSKTEFLLEARRIKMMKDLREIYPIQSLPHERYAIRGLELPSDMNFVDDHVSSALGFTCHLVYMSSKYLSIPLRYRLICNASRSAIFDDDIVYPLFRTNTERPQFDRAVYLLEKNIECLLKVRGVQYLPRAHLLAKLDRLFTQTTEGGIFYHR